MYFLTALRCDDSGGEARAAALRWCGEFVTEQRRRCDATRTNTLLQTDALYIFVCVCVACPPVLYDV